MDNTFDKIQSNYNYYYAANGQYAKTEHGHDFYEIFLTLSDEVLHIINGERQIIHAYTLVFIRPGDRHWYECYNNKFPNFVNLAFRRELVEDFFTFICPQGEELRQSMLDVSMPPKCVLMDKEWRILFSELTRFNTIDPHEMKELQLSAYFFISEIFALFRKKLLKNMKDSTETPIWLESVCEEMERYENFSEGLPRMVELSGRTREYLLRCMKKYKNTTVSAFINDLRLEYAANMLVKSDLTVTELCFDCGFNSIDYFEKLFKIKYGIAPSKFRIQMKKEES